jgi:hypothetical protein
MSIRITIIDAQIQHRKTQPLKIKEIQPQHIALTKKGS